MGSFKKYHEIGTMMKFKEWLLSETIVFHGTETPFAGFDKNKQLSGYYPGFYCTSEKNHAKVHGGLVYTGEINEEKFFEMKPGKEDDLKMQARKAGFSYRMGSGSEECKYLQQLGYEGIKRGVVYIVFDPEKSLRNFKPLN